MAVCGIGMICWGVMTPIIMMFITHKPVDISTGGVLATLLATPFAYVSIRCVLRTINAGTENRPWEMVLCAIATASLFSLVGCISGAAAMRRSDVLFKGFGLRMATNLLRLSPFLLTAGLAGHKCGPMAADCHGLNLLGAVQRGPLATVTQDGVTHAFYLSATERIVIAASFVVAYAASTLSDAAYAAQVTPGSTAWDILAETISSRSSVMDLALNSDTALPRIARFVVSVVVAIGTASFFWGESRQ